MKAKLKENAKAVQLYILDKTRQIWQLIANFVAIRPRISLGILALWLLFLVYLGSWAGCYRVPLLQKVSPFEAIPYNTALVLETHKPLIIIENWRKEPAGEAWQKLHFMRQWADDIDSLNAVFVATETNKDLLKNANVVSGAQWGDRNYFSWLFVISSPEDFDLRPIIENKIKSYSTTRRRYRNHDIFELKKEGQPIFALAKYKGLLLVCRQAHAVETALEQIDKIRTNIFFTPNFNATYKRLYHKEGMNIYVGLRDLPILLANLRPNTVQPISDLGRNFDWAGLSLALEPERLRLTGSLSAAKENYFFYALSRQNTVAESNIAELLPDNTAFSFYLAPADFKSFYKAYQQEKYPDFEEFVLPFMKSEVLFFLTNPTAMDLSANKFVALRLTDSTKAAALLGKYAEKYGELENTSYQNFEIRRIATTDLLQPIFAGQLQPLQNPYYVIIDDFAIFANNLAALQVWIEKYNFDKKLVRLPQYQSLGRTMSRDNHIHIFAQLKYILPALQAYTDPEMHSFFERQMQEINQFHSFTLQLQAQKTNVFSCHLGLHFGADTLTANSNINAQPQTQGANVAWQFDLKDPIKGQPQVLVNPNGGHYIAVQDTSDRLYLFTQSGELLWEYVLDLPIISQIYGLNFNNTKNLQLVFNTQNGIYFIDINGALLQKIPLPSPATVGILLIDYEHGVRILLGCNNGNIYGYDKSGVPLTGWNPKANVGRLAQPLQLALSDKKHVLVGQFANGRIGIFNFDVVGKAIYVPSISPNLRGFYVDEQIGRIAVGLQNGGMQVINFKGNTFALAADNRAMQNLQFAYADFVGDTRRDYLRYSNGRLILHYYDEKNQFLPAWEQDLAERPTDIFSLLSPRSLHYRIGGLHRGTGQIYLYDEKGQLLKGFPLAGTSKFTLVDLVGDRSEAIVVANQAKLVVYKLDAYD